jgi:sugar-specific transcriptional regulator TrmB
MIIDKKIQELGLTDKETKVYVALLELGQATAQQLAIKSGVNRATTYVMLESLMNRGLISTIEKEKKTFFIIEEPFALLKHLQDEREQMDDQISKAKQLIPELQLMYNLTRERSSVRLFEGKESVRIIQNEIARSKSKTFKQITNISLALDYFPSKDDDHRKKLLKKKTWEVQSIVAYNPAQPLPHLDMWPKEKRRYISESKVPIYADIAFYDGKVSILSIKDQIVGVTIENESIYKTMESLFDALWQISDKDVEIEKV